MKMNKAFRYQIYPNQSQLTLINKTFGCCRFIYNKMLSDKIDFYNEQKLTLNNTPAQYKDKYKWLKEVDSLALANEQMHLQTAFNNFFLSIKKHKKVGFPKYKSRKHSKKSYTTNNIGNTLRIEKGKIKLPKLGYVKYDEHRIIPKNYTIKSATISQISSGKYFISILTEYEYEVPVKKLDKNKALGLDYSSPDFYVDSQDRKPENYTHLFRKHQSKLAKEQRKLSHMQLHSNHYEKQKIKIAKVHEMISNKRKEFIETLSTKLASEYDIICIEDINLQGMSQTLNLGKSTMDNGFGLFRTRLEQKLYLLGKELVKVDKFYPSSKTCNGCGCVNKDLKLSDRQWICPECGMVIERDYNASLNILNEGLRILNL